MHKACCQVPQGTKFYIMTPNIFSVITALSLSLSLFLHKKVASSLSRNFLIKVTFTDQSRIPDPLYGTRFRLPFCHLEFGGCSQLSGKFVDPWFKEIWTPFIYRVFNQTLTMNEYEKLLQENQDTLSHDYYERFDLILMCTNNIRLWVSDKTGLTFVNPLHCTHCCTAECALQ